MANFNLNKKEEEILKKITESIEFLHGKIGKISYIVSHTGKTGISQYTSEIPMKNFTPVELKYGDCVVHNQFSVHYSNENSTSKPRIAITCIIKLNKNRESKLPTQI